MGQFCDIFVLYFNFVPDSAVEDSYPRQLLFVPHDLMDSGRHWSLGTDHYFVILSSALGESLVLSEIGKHLTKIVWRFYLDFIYCFISIKGLHSLRLDGSEWKWKSSITNIKEIVHASIHMFYIHRVSCVFCHKSISI